MQWWVLKKRLHVSWIIAGLCCALLVGVWLRQYVSIEVFGSNVWLVAGCGLVSAGLVRNYRFLLPLVILGGLMLGLWRGTAAESELTDIRALQHQAVTISGHVREDVDTDSAGATVLRLDSLMREGQVVHGTLWVSGFSQLEIKRGDVVDVTGKIGNGFGSFAGTMFQAEIASVKRPQPGDIARQIRDWISDSIRLAIPSPESSLGIGFLVGQKRALPADLVEALQIAGLTHVVVASGYNLTILVRLARRLFERVSKYLSMLAASGMIAIFIAITGLSPSMSRAGLVAGLSLLAWYYGRRFHPLVLLPLAAAVTVMINPSYAWGDLGWQLSFASFAGVMIVAPLFHRYFFGDKNPGTVRQILGETIAAVIVTAPILMNAFGQFSNVSVIANLLILPFVPLAMLLTFVAGIGALMFPMAATLFGTPAQLLLGYMISTAKYLAGLPWAVSTVSFAGWAIAIYYVVLAAICVYMWRQTKFDLASANIVQ